jgi:hypothetical protein
MENVLNALQQDLTETEMALLHTQGPHELQCLEQRRSELLRMIARLQNRPADA